MELADVTLMAFTLCNSIHVLANLPADLKAVTDPHVTTAAGNQAGLGDGP
jgi:hypothetical protein